MLDQLKEKKMKSNNTQRTETRDTAKNMSNEYDLLKLYDTQCYLILLLTAAGGLPSYEMELLKGRDALNQLMDLLGELSIEIENVNNLTPLVTKINIKCDSKIADKINTSSCHKIDHIEDNVWRISLLDGEYPLDTGSEWLSWLKENDEESPFNTAMTWIGSIIETRYLLAH
jgi:hypothetical protein